MAFRVVDDMPMPSSRSRNGSKGGSDKYGLRDLKIGQAIIVDKDDPGFVIDKRGYVATHKIMSSAIRIAKLLDRKFASRRLDDGSFGVWRVK